MIGPPRSDRRARSSRTIRSRSRSLILHDRVDDAASLRRAACRTTTTLDPQFKSLLRHHWMEEAQHAKLDTLMVESARRELQREGDRRGGGRTTSRSAASSTRGWRQQVEFDLDALERATGRILADRRARGFIAQQHQARRWTYLGSGMTPPALSRHPRAAHPGAPPARCRGDRPDLLLNIQRRHDHEQDDHMPETP